MQAKMEANYGVVTDAAFQNAHLVASMAIVQGDFNSSSYHFFTFDNFNPCLSHLICRPFHQIIPLLFHQIPKLR